jgi:hypothetical protein
MIIADSDELSDYHGPQIRRKSNAIPPAGTAADAGGLCYISKLPARPRQTHEGSTSVYSLYSLLIPQKRKSAIVERLM